MVGRERPAPTDDQVERMAEILVAMYPRSYKSMKHARRVVRHCHFVMARYGPEPSITHRYV